MRGALDICPMCGGDQIRHDGEQSEPGKRFAYMGCRSCGARWTETYVFGGFVVTQDRRVLL